MSATPIASAPSVGTVSAPHFDKAQARAYLARVHCDLDGWIDIRSIAPDGGARRYVARTSDDVLEISATATAAGRNVYTGVATRRTGLTEPGAGGKDQLVATRALWCDIDFKEEGDAEALEIRLEGFPLPPSFRVWSGGGVHLYWIVEEATPLDTPARVRRFEHALKGIADVLGGDQAATDASRVLRVPGTTNWPDARKRAAGREPAPCFIIQ